VICFSGSYATASGFHNNDLEYVKCFVEKIERNQTNDEGDTGLDLQHKPPAKSRSIILKAPQQFFSGSRKVFSVTMVANMFRRKKDVGA